MSMLCKCEICRLGNRAVAIVSKRVVCMNCMAKLLKGMHLLIRGPENPDYVHAFLTDDRVLAYQKGTVPEKHNPKYVTVPDMDEPKALPVYMGSESVADDYVDPSTLDKRSKEYRDWKASQELQTA